MMYTTNEGEEFIESVFYPNGIDHSNEDRKNRVPRLLWDFMIDDIFDKGKISLKSEKVKDLKLGKNLPKGTNSPEMLSR